MHPLAVERLTRGWSQQKVAETLGVSVRTIVRWERGQSLPYPYYREQLCILFDKDADALGLLTVEVATSDPSPKALSASTERSASLPLPLTAVLDPFIPSGLSRSRALLGREDLLSQLKTFIFRGPEARLIALYGLPGVGKTSIALALATDPEVHSQFPDGILWVSLGPHPDIPTGLAHWGSLLGLSPKDIEHADEASSWVRALRTVIAHRRFLLVIDDAWSGEDALAFQVGGPSCVHLLTSRLPLVAETFASHTTFPIPSLNREDGIALLARYVPTIVEQEQQQVQELVQAVDGLPLALTLMGKYLAFQAFTGQPHRFQRALNSLHDVQQRLAISTPLTSTEHPVSLENILKDRRFSLQAAIAINDQLVSASAHQALLALSVFPTRPQTFSEAAALAVTATSEQDLDELWDAGLLETDPGGRYTLHQTISDYARVQREGTGALERLVRYIAQFVQQHEQDYKVLETELSTIQVALDAAISLKMEAELVQSVLILTDFWYIRGLYRQGEHYVQQAWLQVQAGDHTVWQIKLLQDLARFTEVLNSNQEAQAYAQRGLMLAQNASLPHLEGALLSRLEDLARNTGQQELAQQYCQQGLMLAEQVGDELLKANFLYGLGSVRINQRDYAEANEVLHEALAIAQREQQQELAVQLFRTLTKLFTQKSQFEQVIHYGREGLLVAQLLGYRSLQCTLLNSIGVSLAYQGHHEQAIAAYEEALTLARQIGHRVQTAIALANLAMTLVEQNIDQKRAAVYLGETVELVRQFGIQEFGLQDALPIYLVGPEHLRGYFDNYDMICGLFQQNIDLAQRQKRHWDETTMLFYLGELHLFFKRPDVAKEAFERALSLNKGAQADPQLVGRVQYGLARIAAFQEKYREAHWFAEQSLATLAQIGHHLAKQVQVWLEVLPLTES